jgi:uncharacterized protein (TIGR02246 family)
MSDLGNVQGASGTDSAAATAAEAMVQANIDAYNAHDLEAYLATFAPTAMFGQLGGRVLLDGREAMRGFYRQFFESRPRVQCAIEQRAVMGRFVVDRQRIFEPAVEGASGTGQAMPPMQAMVISEIAAGDPEGRIGKVWYSPLTDAPGGRPSH